MQKHSKIAMCRLRRHGMRFQRVGRGRPTCAKLHALLLLLVFVARPERMKFLFHYSTLKLSFKLTERLNTSFSGVESLLSTQK